MSTIILPSTDGCLAPLPLGPPVTVFYGADGTQVASVVGELSQQTLDQHLADITS